MLEFAQPAAFWTALAISLPIIAHMAYRRVTRKFAFSSLRFIRPSRMPRTGKKKPSDLFLLFLRVMFFVTLTILLADPYWISASEDSAPEKRTEVLLAIDLSPSMQGWGSMQEAKRVAVERIKQSESRMGLVTFGGEILKEWPIGTEEQILTQAVEDLGHDWQKGNPQVMLERIASFFGKDAQKKNLIIISDFQKGDWQSTFQDLASKGIDYELVQVGSLIAPSSRSANRSIAEIRAVPSGPDKIRIWVVVRNWEDTPIEDELALTVGGEEAQRTGISLPPFGSAQAQFILPAGTFSKAKVELLGKDSFSLDDEREILLKSPPARNFGFWLKNENHPDTIEEKNFLKFAILSAGDNGWNRWELNQDSADAMRLGEELPSIDFLLILGMGNWFSEEKLSPLLLNFLQEGGVAMVTPDNLFSATVSNMQQSKLMDFTFLRLAGGASRNPTPFRFSALDQGSQLEQVFAGSSAKDLYLTSIKRFGILRKLAQNLEIPLRDREGRPLGVVRNFKKGGRLVFLPFRMSSSWSDLPFRNSFLPLIMELAKQGENASSSKSWPVLKPGETWGEENFFQAEKPGVFRFQNQWLEVVLSSAESSPDTLPLVEIQDALGSQSLKPPSRVELAGLSSGETHSLWLWFAIFAVIILVIEMLVSRPSKSSSKEIVSSHE